MQFSHKMPLYFFYTMGQKSQKWPKTQIKGGPALIFFSSSPERSDHNLEKTAVSDIFGEDTNAKNSHE